MSGTWIKICGMTSPEAVDAALAARVDAIGFVFAESVRQLSLERAAQLAAPARGRVLCVAVTRHPPQDRVDEIVSVFRPDVLQSDIEDFEVLNLPRQLELLPVLRQGSQADLPPRVLFEGKVSGSGTLSDWHAAGELAQRTQLVLAGGLSADNVGTAIKAVRPFGVDVSSAVEERPGVKSPQKIAKFIEAVRNVAVR